MTKREHLYSGKAKSLFKTDVAGQLIMHFRDDLTAFDGKKKAVCEKKGIYNNHINAFLMTHLNKQNIKTHFIRREDERECLVCSLNMIKLEFIVRNIAAGTICSRLGLSKGTVLDAPVFELYLKNDSLSDPLVNDSHIQLLRIHSLKDIRKAQEIALSINEYLCALFQGVSIDLVDFKLEFGIDDDRELRVGDEITPDSCRLWDKESRNPLDKDLFRFNLGDLLTGYETLSHRLGIEI